MDLVDVDDVRLQTAQRILDLLDDPAFAGVAVRFVVLPG
jgi:Arc/MetJ family transcription regulator